MVGGLKMFERETKRRTTILEKTHPDGRLFLERALVGLVSKGYQKERT